MDSKPAQQDSKPQQAQPEVKKPKAKRNRRFSKDVISESERALVLNVKHTPYKGEKLSDTVRKDNKFDPQQRFYTGQRPL